MILTIDNVRIEIRRLSRQKAFVRHSNEYGVYSAMSMPHGVCSGFIKSIQAAPTADDKMRVSKQLTDMGDDPSRCIRELFARGKKREGITKFRERLGDKQIPVIQLVNGEYYLLYKMAGNTMKLLDKEGNRVSLPYCKHKVVTKRVAKYFNKHHYVKVEINGAPFVFSCTTGKRVKSEKIHQLFEGGAE